MSTGMWLLTTGVLLVAVYVAAMWVIGHRRGKGMLLLPVLRLVFLGIGVLLIWKAFWGRVEARKAKQEGIVPLKLVILEDASASMGFMANGQQTRAELAQEVTDALTAAAEASPTPVELERFVFADRLLPASQVDSLATGASQLNEALTTALARLEADRLLVISDGASTDGPVPGYLLDWLHNRRIGLFTVAAADPTAEVFDWRVEQLEAARVNPPHLAVEVRALGKTTEPGQLQVVIDGENVKTTTLTPGEERYQVNVEVPELEPGWHVYEARIMSAGNELTDRNNRRIGVFRQTLPNRILYLYGAFRMENVHVAKLLKAQFGDRVTILQARDPAIGELRTGQYNVMIASDVDLPQIPETLEARLQSGELTCLLLAGAHTTGWTARSLKGFPVSEFQQTMNLHERLQREGTVVVHQSNRDPIFFNLDLGRLSLNLVELGRFTPQATTVFAVKTANQQLPLLLADRATSPRYLVMLADTTWKWAMSPEPLVRHQQRVFWNKTFSWLMGEAEDTRPLNLEFVEKPEHPGMTEIRVTASEGVVYAHLQNLTLTIEDEEGAQTVTPVRGDDGFTYDFRHPHKLPQVIWFQARGEYRGEVWQSERQPRVINGNDLEWLQPLPRPEILSAGMSEGGQFAFAGEVRGIFPKLLAPPAEGPPPPLIRQRNRGQELLLGCVLALLLAVEWWFERWLKDHR